VASGGLYVGTSGFAFPGWKGTFYPEGTRDADMLGRYAERLPSVEINYTFRRHPAESTLERWRDQTPDTFRFALKAHRRITHTLRLRDADGSVSTFLERARLLGDRLGPILFQCPPTLEYDHGLLAAFLGYLPPTILAAFEFRHPSWSDARDLLAEQGAVWCDAETDEQTLERISPGRFAYLRLRRDDYSDRELGSWGERIATALEEGRDVYAYVKHEAAAAPDRAARLVTAAGISR
jgi:uncharacterized protein YecE (DUF72 family)